MDYNMPDNIQLISPGTISILSGWPFISCCLVIAIIILTIKRACKQFWPNTYKKSVIHGIFTLSYLVLGMCLAIPKYLPGANVGSRLIVGILASGASLLVYHAAYKRLAKMVGLSDEYVNDLDDLPNKS
jgi:uncharacterized membrane protein YoaK (UPF0700 family)